jgi:integrase
MASYIHWQRLGDIRMTKLAKPSKPARLVKAKQGWYIIWYSQNDRFRLKNGINTIKDLEKRLFYSCRIVNFINDVLQNGQNIRDIDLPASLFDFSDIAFEQSSQIKFIAYFERYIESLKKQNLSFYTIRKHITLYNNLKLYAAHCGVSDFDFASLDKKWAIEYKTWRFAPPFEHHINYVSKDFDKIRGIIEDAEAEGNIAVNPKYKTEAFKVKKILSDEVALVFSDVERIFKLDLSEECKGLNIVRDDFVLACLTGLRWGNWCIKKEHVVEVHGRKRLKILTQKNYATCHIPLHPIALEILKKYDYDLPILSGQKTNKYVKLIAEKAGLTDVVLLKDSKGGKIVMDNNRKCDEITTHTARRTFVVIALTEWHISPAFVMQITGHKTQRQLFEYARIEGEYAASEFERAFDAM